MKKSLLLYSLIGFAMMGGLILPSKVLAFTDVVIPTSIVSGVFHLNLTGWDVSGSNDIYSYDVFEGSHFINDGSPLHGTTLNIGWTSWCQPLSGHDCILNGSSPTTYGFNTSLPLPDGDYWFRITDFFGNTGVFNVTFSGGLPVPPDTTTHFSTLTLSTTTQTVRFTGYISPSDSDVHLIFNVSTPLYSQWDHEDLTATTTGNFDQSFIYQNFSTSTIDQFTFTGTLVTPHVCFTDCETSPPSMIYDTISTTTNANGIGITNLPTPSDTILAVAANCNPFSGFFNVSSCVSYLFFPDPVSVSNNTTRIRDTLLTKVPIGYFTRLFSILTSHSTTTIPAISYTWQNDNGPLAGKTWTINVDDYMDQARVLTGEMTSNSDHKTAWQIFEPFINTFLAIFVLYGMIHDVMGLNLIHHKK